MTNPTRPFLTHSIDLVGDDADALAMVCSDPASGQSLRFANVDGRQVITYSRQLEGITRQVTLSEGEAADLAAWRNNGRRTSYWDWPGWESVRKRSKTLSSS